MHLSKSLVKLFFTFIVFILILSSVVMAGTKATVYAKTGQEFHDVSFTVDNQLQIIIFEYNGEVVNVSFIQVKQIIDYKGNDITESVIGEWQEDKENNWMAKYDRVSRQDNYNPYSVYFDFMVDYGVPFGDYYGDAEYDGYTIRGPEGGVGFGGALVISVSRNYDLRFMVGKSGIKLPKEWNPVKMTAMRYLVGLQWHSHCYSFERCKSIWYGNGSLGVIDHKIEINGYSDTQSTFTLNIGGGVLIPIDRGFSLDIGIDLDQVIYNDEIYGEKVSSRGFIFNLNVGLAIMVL